LFHPIKQDDGSVIKIIADHKQLFALNNKVADPGSVGSLYPAIASGV
jgi:hypothetical protein